MSRDPRTRARTQVVAVMVAAAVGGSILTGSALTTASAAPAGGDPSPHQSVDASDGLDGRSGNVLLARPNKGKAHLGRNLKWGADSGERRRTCHATRPICVHWTTEGAHAPPAVDGDNDTIPDRVEQVLAAAATSWARIVGDLGFRAPRGDLQSNPNGGDGRLDFYLADTGAQRLGGYTSSDDPRLSPESTYKYRDVSAFIVVDNDFRAGQFSGHTPLEHLQATVAHEFFHAVQFAYDYREDPWLVEGTAAWIEDEVFDDVNLNRDYLQHSVLAAPLTPLDLGRQKHQYGAWIFFRYLSERFGPKIIARIWRLADDSPNEVSAKALRTYSMVAVRKALAREDRTMRTVFANFMRANLHPARSYEEGSSYFAPWAPAWNLNQRGDDTGWAGFPLNHLSAFYINFKPGVNAPPGRRLLVRFDTPPRWSGSEARVVVRYKDGKLVARTVRLGKRGNGEVRVDFGRAKVAGVKVALINASTRYAECFKRGTSLPCRGVAKDDGRNYKVRARVI